MANFCREAFGGVTDVALLRALRAQGSVEVCAQVLGSSLVPRPFSLYLYMAHVRDNAVATSPSCAKIFKSGSSATSWIGVKVSSLCSCEVEHLGYVLWNSVKAPTQLSSLLRLQLV